MVAALSVYGQGNVNFANVGVGLNSPFFDGTQPAGTRITGGTWTIELWAGPNASDVGAALAGVAFSGSFANGYFNAGQRTVSNVTGGSAFAQVRIWDNMGGTVTSWAAAQASQTVRLASSSWFAITLSTPPATPATMVNLPTGITVNPVPEPSTIALGILGGLGALLFRRRK